MKSNFSHQERFWDADEFERGLKAAPVAKRCAVLGRAEDRELVWFLQLLSHREGGLPAVAADIKRTWPDRIATASMQKFGNRPGQQYNAAQVKAVRAEFPGGEPDFSGLSVVS